MPYSLCRCHKAPQHRRNIPRVPGSPSAIFRWLKFKLILWACRDSSDVLGLVLALHSMRISRAVPTLREVLAVHPTACCTLRTCCCWWEKEQESAGNSPSLLQRSLTATTATAIACPLPCPHHRHRPFKREKKDSSARSNGDDENEYKESTRRVLGQRRQRCLKESMHANWKCQEWLVAHALQNP